MTKYGWIFILRWCLPFSSSHPNHCKKNIPVTLARRICIIVENQQQKVIHQSELKKKNLKKYDVATNVNVVINSMMMILVTGTWDCLHNWRRLCCSIVLAYCSRPSNLKSLRTYVWNLWLFHDNSYCSLIYICQSPISFVNLG